MEMQNKIPNWEAQGTEPPDSLKNSGFVAGYKPPADYFNWFWHGVGVCLKELFEKLSGHAANNENPHNVTAAQLGLDKVNNTSDTEKYVKYAQEAGTASKIGSAFTVRLNGGRTEGSDVFTYDGSVGKAVNITPGKIGAAEKSQAVALTVAASAWTGEGPYTATVACSLATASNNLVVGAGGALTEDQQAAMAEAMIVCTAQAAGSITLTAFGTMPEIDLPFNVLEVG